MSENGDITILHGDCRDILPTLGAGSVDAIVTDPPYYRVKMDEEWDRQWPTPEAYLSWIGELCREWRRVLAPNGSLYVFASPEMAARVECKIGERFNVLNRITWIKNDGDVVNGGGKWRQTCKEVLRCYFPRTEAIIFAERPGSDTQAIRQAGYEAKCDEAARDVFGRYIGDTRKRHNLTMKDLTAAIGAHGAVNHGGACSNWEKGLNLPTREYYDKLQATFPGCFDREYEELRQQYEELRQQYEELRQQYEELRRPFSVDDSVPYTDVWDFATVPTRPDKHPCEKPLAMIEHIVAASSRPGDLVLDSFSGSGVTGQACRNLGRRCILIEKDPHWVNASRVWLDRPHARIPREKVRKPLPLFAGLESNQ